MVQGIGRDDRVISVLFQRLDQPLCKIALIKLGLRHFDLGQLNHPLRKILPIHGAAVLVELLRQRARAETDIQHGLTAVCQHRVVDGVQHALIARKRVRVPLVRQADTSIVSVRPQIKALFV